LKKGPGTTPWSIVVEKAQIKAATMTAQRH